MSMSAVDCHMWFRNFVHALKIIESDNSSATRVRRFQGNNPFDTFVVEEKYKIDFIKLADVLTKYLEDDARVQRLPAQRPTSAAHRSGSA